jgi:outer membrane protein OmpA-like peptidoglycan-associated protein
MKNTRTLAVAAAIAAISLATVGCATKKHVREAIAPVQNQVNDVQKQGQDTQKQTQENRQSIGDLDRQVASTDEKATDAGKRANAAAEAAAAANTLATQAGQRADAANTAAQQVGNKLDTSLSNLSNYKLVSTQQVFFKPGRSTLSKEEQAKLDTAISQLGGMKTVVIEVEGFADRTGSKALNLELARKRADTVVHYLAVEHNVALRDIRELGVGSEFPDADNKTRAARAQNRRVDVKVYALDLTGNGRSVSGASDRTASPSDSAKLTPKQ